MKKIYYKWAMDEDDLYSTPISAFYFIDGYTFEDYLKEHNIYEYDYDHEGNFYYLKDEFGDRTGELYQIIDRCDIITINKYLVGKEVLPHMPICDADVKYHLKHNDYELRYDFEMGDYIDDLVTNCEMSYEEALKMWEEMPSCKYHGITYHLEIFT